jgi:hypothetical protein
LGELIVEIVEAAEKGVPYPRVRQPTPYQPRAHQVPWVLIHGLAGLGSHAAWHICEKMSNDFEIITKTRKKILDDFYSEIKLGIKQGKPILQIIEELGQKYEAMTGEPISVAREHIPKSIEKIEKVFGIKFPRK